MLEGNNKIRDFSPPANYHPVASLVGGISVYAPIESDQNQVIRKSYKCPKCGANVTYDLSAGGVACEFCGYTSSTEKDIVGKNAEEFEFTLDTINKAEKGWGIERKIFHCNSCGAELAVVEGAITSLCPFCASHEVNIQVALSPQLRPKFIIPFKIQKVSTRTILEDWLGKGWYHPDDLKINTVLDRFLGIYLPFWTFDSQIVASWKALVGYETEKRYFDHNSAEWKTRTEIEWRWRDGNINLYIDDLIIPGSSHISDTILEGIQPFSLSELELYNPDYLAGWQAHAYDVTLLDAWENGKNTIRERTKQACYSSMGSKHIRNFSMVADFSGETWRYILLPLYLSSYRYENKVFQVMINGQTGSIAGQKPVAWWKIWLVIAAILSPGACIGLAGIPLLLAGGIGILPIVIGVIALILGSIFALKIYQDAVRSEAL